MTNSVLTRIRVRRVDIVKMFFGIANALNTKGRDMFFQPTDNGGVYTFRLGDNLLTYSIQKGGML